MTAGQAISAMKPDQHGTCSWKAETEPQSQKGTSLPKHHHPTATTGKRRKRTGCQEFSSVCVCYFRRPTDVIKRLDNIGNIPQFRSRSHEHKGTQPNQAFSAYPLRAFGMSRGRTSKREMIVAGSNQTARRKEPQKKKKYSRTIESASWCANQTNKGFQTLCAYVFKLTRIYQSLCIKLTGIHFQIHKIYIYILIYIYICHPQNGTQQVNHGKSPTTKYKPLCLNKP